MSYNKERYERMKREGICVQCKKRPAERGKTRCELCRKSNWVGETGKKAKAELKKERMPRKQPEESLDEIARKAHEHHMSYGKYLQARAQGRVK